VGIQIRTKNAAEMNGEGLIPGVWSRFFADDLLSQIPNRSSEILFVVYSNYASDELDYYDYLLGCPVDSIEIIPEGMTYAAIATGDYAVFTTETGPVAEVVQAAWKHIWLQTPKDLGHKRAFLTDYEVYDHRALDPNNAKVEIHIGLEADPA
jgi:predicted transcriptional regulator YdeE